jgi:pimeloyl-ACP methyl ester carboxylesterase
VSLSDGAEAAFTDHDNGKTSGVPVVLLHGLTQQQHYWGPVLARLAGRRVITVDQRGHGEASGAQVTPQSDFSIPRLARDVIEILDQAGVPEAVVVGHSWGASVALHTASTFPDRVRAAVLIDGGIFGPRHLVTSDRSAEEVREALRPPALGIAQPALWQAIESGDLAEYWSDDIQRALAPTFRVDEEGLVFTRLGMDRHMAVLDGLFAYDPRPDIAVTTRPTWVVVCEPGALDPSTAPAPTERADPAESLAQAWTAARGSAMDRLGSRFYRQRWSGAHHDVPLQWPALVAGLVETVLEHPDAGGEAE